MAHSMLKIGKTDYSDSSDISRFLCSHIHYIYIIVILVHFYSHILGYQGTVLSNFVANTVTYANLELEYLVPFLSNSHVTNRWRRLGKKCATIYHLKGSNTIETRYLKQQNSHKLRYLLRRLIRRPHVCLFQTYKFTIISI